MLLQTKYQSSCHCGYRQEDTIYAYVTPVAGLYAYLAPVAGHFDHMEHNLNKPGIGQLGEATYQI